MELALSTLRKWVTLGQSLIANSQRPRIRDTHKGPPPHLLAHISAIFMQIVVVFIMLQRACQLQQINVPIN